MAHSAYVHIPFCTHKCDFCDFTAFAGLDELMEPYAQIVCREIQQRLQARPNLQPFSSVFYGGGTPGLIAVSQLRDIHQALITHAGLACDAEVTLETTPQSITAEKLEGWQSLGINRLSIGVESLQEEELSAMGRGQGRDAALHALSLVSKSGFTSVSCDLMYGLPTQTLDSWRRTLAEALSFGLPHLSAYGLTISTNSPLLLRYPRESAAYPDEERFVSMYEALVEMTAEAGLVQYEISNFARVGFESKHNWAYWMNEEYQAFGVGAYRYVDGIRSLNWRSMKRYMQDWLGHEADESVDSQMRRKEGIFLQLRTRRGIELQQFQQKYDFDLESQHTQSIAKFIAGGFMEKQDGFLRLTQKGILVSNLVMSEFM